MFPFCSMCYPQLIMATLMRYLITLLLWVIIIVIIENTKNNYAFSIDTAISIMTLFSLMLQNLKVKEITNIQDWLVNKINMYDFFILNSHIFFIICLITAVIMPIGLNQFNFYLVEFGDLSSWRDLFKLIIKVSFFFGIELYFLSFIGKNIDNSVGNNTGRKYGLFYALLLVIYITTKLT